MVYVGDKIVMAGDWHGATVWGTEVIDQSANRGVKTIFHLGDFGFWPGDWGAYYIKRLDKVLAHQDVMLVVTPGNHEDYDRLDSKKAKDIGDGWGEVQHMTDHIIVLPRGHRVELEYSGGSRSLVSLGGAPSIDFEHRVEGRSWWKSEMITMDDVEKTIAGGHADIMVAHDSPDVPWAAPRVQEILAHGGFWSDAGLRYAAEGRALMHQAYEGVMPKIFFHGHYHVFSVGYHDHGQVWSLSNENTGGNVALVDLDRLSVV